MVLTAFAQAQVINKHLLKGTNGRTYAEFGARAKKPEAAGDTAAEDFTQQRTSAMNGLFLRASLFTSVLAYGVSALLIGLRLLQIRTGLVFTRLAKRDVA